MGLLDLGSALAQVDQFKRRIGLLASDPSAFAASHGGAELGAAPSQAGGLLSVVPQVREDAITQAMRLTPGLLGATSPLGYRGSHTAPDMSSAPAHDLTANSVYPADVYDMGAKWYGTGDDMLDNFAFGRMREIRGKPDTPVVIWRAVPKDAEMKINPGDWVTISHTYARNHGESIYGAGNFKMIRRSVPAKDIFTNGDSILEWGYAPK